MLTLQTHSWDYDNLIPRSYRNVDSNIVLGRTAIPNGPYVYGTNVASALAPLFFNDIPYETKTISQSGEDITAERIADLIKEYYETITDKELLYIRCYTSYDKIQEIYDAIDKDIFTSTGTAVELLYNKCIDQVIARENYTGNYQIKVLKSRTKHMIISITNLRDRIQESDFFLTEGLIPIFFEDYKAKFNEKELDFFKILVNRSQVKRISNVAATNAFKALFLEDNKYKDLFNKFKLEGTIIQLVNSRINEAENTTQDAMANAERYLEEYHKMKKKYYESQDTLKQLRDNKGDAIEELKAALNMNNIVRTNINGGVLEIFIRTYADFYNQDEAELVIDNRTSGWVKQLFTDLFIEQKYKLRLLTKFYFTYNSSNSSFHKPGSLDMQTLSNENCLFNPHIQFFSCLGDYLPQITDAHAKKDLLLFNNLAIASTRSINFRDGTVMNRWIQFLKDNIMNDYTYISAWDIKCLEDEDGNLHSIREIYMQEPPTVEVQDL